MKAAEISLHAGHAPRKLEAVDAGRRLTLTDGHQLDADLVFFATGRESRHSRARPGPGGRRREADGRGDRG